MNLRSSFHLICIVITVSLLGYCSLKFYRNESTSMVDFRSYFDTEKDIYPSLSLCFEDGPLNNVDGVYKKKILQDSYDIENQSIYTDFLEGIYWDDKLVNVDYDAVTFNLFDYVETINIRLNSHTSTPVYTWNSTQDHAKETFPFRTTFRQAKTKCFSFDFSLDLIPNLKKNNKKALIRAFSFALKSLTSLSLSLVYFVHYPNQLLRTSPLTVEHLKHAGVISGNLIKKQFWIDNLEVLRRRNTMNSPCFEDSKQWDQYVFSQMLDRTNCRPPQWSNEKLICQDNDSMQKLNIVHENNPDFIGQFTEPCDEVQSVSYNVEEFNRPQNTTLNTSTEIMFLFKYGKYKDILHVRSFNVESLIGNMGGYIGLFLGFAIWQAPDIGELVFKMIKRIIS